MKFVVCFISIFALLNQSLGQSNLSLEFVGLTIHPGGDPTADLQPNKLDKNARFVVNYGGVLTYEKYILSDVLAIKGLQANFVDCSAGWASITQIGIKGMAIRKPNHRLGVSLGPAFMIRESWHRFEDYNPSGFLNEGNSQLFGPIQYKLFPLAIEVEYDVKISEHWDFTASVTPGIPMAITFGCGMKYWFSREFKHKLFLPKVK